MILGFIEHDRGTINPISLQMLTYGRDLSTSLGMPLRAVLIGHNSPEVLEQLRRYGVSQTYVVDDARLQEYAPEAWGKCVAQLIQSADPQIVLAASTDRGNEVLAWAGAVSGLPMAANCVQLDPASLNLVRLRWGGSLLEEATLHATSKLLTIAPFIIDAKETDNPGEGKTEAFSPKLDEKDFRVRVIAREEAQTEGVSLQSAPVVVGGGRGVGSAEGFHVLEELATLLGAAVGGSRVATNNGWRPHSQQIGLTGNRIAPDLYIACGISGAIQHLVGCKGAKRVLVINKDREAPFFRRADYGVVGDLHEVLPALIAEVKKRRSQT